MIFGVEKVCKSGGMLDKWGNFVIILWHGEIVLLGMLAYIVFAVGRYTCVRLVVY